MASLQSKEGDASKSKWMYLLHIMASTEKRYDIKSETYQNLIKTYNLGINRTIYQWWDYVHGISTPFNSLTIPSNLDSNYYFDICDKVIRRSIEQIAVPKNHPL